MFGPSLRPIFGRPGMEISGYVLVSAHKDSRPSDAKDSGFLADTRTYQKIFVPGLPKIGLNDGPNILHIRDASIQYCQRELGPITGIFLDGKYKSPATASYDPNIVAADKTLILKDQASAKLKRADGDN
jgi:hypothetical protein